MKRFVIAVLIAFPALALSQNITESRIQFAAGSSGTTIEGSIKGDAIIDYMLGAQAGQRMVIAFEADNPSAYFNLLPSDDPTALHIGSVAGNGYEGTLIRSGDYRVRVYLMRNAARRGETAAYTLSVSITGNPAPTELPRSPDFADGLSGGPDWWQVANLSPDGTLNVRSGPGVDNAIIGTMKNGDTVRNLGCEMNGASRWCRIELPHDQDVVGWVAGQFLVEAASPSIPSREARGKVPCALQSSQPMGSCDFRVTRHGGGTANVWVTMSDGSERYLDFREGELVGSDPGKQVHQERVGDLNLISIDGSERYEIPDAVLFGG